MVKLINYVTSSGSRVNFVGKKITTGNPHCYFTVTPDVQQEWFWNRLLTMLKLTSRLYVWFKFSLITLSVSFLFSCGEGGRGEGRGHLNCLRLQPGAGAGEKLSKRGSLLILLVLKAIKPHQPHHPIKNIGCLEQWYTKLNSQND